MTLLLPLIIFVLSADFVHADDVCCTDNECYSMDPPWNSTTRQIPAPRCEVSMNIVFRIYTRSNPDYPFNTTSRNISVAGSPYDPRKPTVIIFHGWMNSTNVDAMRALVAAHLACMDANVIVVDYSNVTNNASYPQAVSDIRVVARQVSRFVRHLTDEQGTSPSNIHLVGTSLGAHTASYVGKYFPGLGKITGLDPAGPLFEYHSCTVRLCKGDAMFVENVITNGNPLWGLGTHGETGDVNFLVNGGFDQPGCGYKADNITWAVLKSGNFNIIRDGPQSANCSHTRALHYYIEAIRNKDCIFWGMKSKFLKTFISRITKGYATKFFLNPFTCNLKNCIPMGQDSRNYPARGTFLVATNHREPYCVSAPLTTAGIQVQKYLVKCFKKWFGWT